MACPGRVVAVPPRFTLARVPGRYRATPVYLRRVPGRIKTKYGPMLQQWHRVDEAKGWPCRPPPPPLFRPLPHFSAHFPFEVKKVKFSHTRYRALGPELIPVYRQSARR